LAIFVQQFIIVARSYCNIIVARLNYYRFVHPSYEGGSFECTLILLPTGPKELAEARSKRFNLVEIQPLGEGYKRRSITPTRESDYPEDLKTR
jgi:hypothetical protein